MPAGASTAAAAEELLPMTSAAVELSTLEVDTECQSGESSPKSIYTLSFENLSVFVPGKKSKCYCNRLVQPCKYVAQEYFGMSVQDREPLHALNNITGLLASGELCLILGSNDESKSTLLRALSGRLSKQDKQSGIMALNGRPMMKSYQGWRRICPYVGPSDQDHSPVLTVRETLEFARRCTAATTTTAEEGNNTSSSAQNEAIDRDVHNLMVRLGLDHVADTVIGDENLRGISGGQKRRVTVGEMVLDKNCKYICMENITDGLSSHDSVKLIRDVANVSNCSRCPSSFVAILQF
jgi:ABC-type transport system involved in cytochrome c biogenesis ATPase subunit